MEGVVGGGSADEPEVAGVLTITLAITIASGGPPGIPGKYE